MGTRASEEEVHEVNDALRGLKRPPLEARPDILAEPGPQRSDRSRRHTSGGRHADSRSAGVALDGAALAFLTSRELAAQRKAEKEERERQRQQAGSHGGALAPARGGDGSVGGSDEEEK